MIVKVKYSDYSILGEVDYCIGVNFFRLIGCFRTTRGSQLDMQSGLISNDTLKEILI